MHHRSSRNTGVRCRRTTATTRRAEPQLNRILAISDLHENATAIEWLVSAAGRFDAVIIAGDTVNASPTSGGAVRPLLHLVERLLDRTRVIVCSGNHDLDGVDAHGERTATWTNDVRRLGAVTDGDLLLAGDTAISVLPWWDGPRGMAHVGDLVAGHHPDVDGRRWIWVHHAPPVATRIANDGVADRGDALLPQLLSQHRPDLVVCGHVHEAPFVDGGDWHDAVAGSIVVNAGQRPGPTPCHIVVDVGADTLRWSGHPSIPGTEETIDLVPAPYAGPA
ncbi:MAG: metallophosphoesterase [Actinomycetota bacterium]